MDTRIALGTQTAKGVEISDMKGINDEDYFQTTHHRKPLETYVNAGIKLIPWIGDAPAVKYADPVLRARNAISTIDQLHQWQRKGAERFGFVPADHGLLILDLDVKSGKNGLLVLKELLPDFRMRVYVRTPNDGFHVYFKTSDVYKSTELYPRKYSSLQGFECISASHLCTAGGSFKNGKRYELYGDFDHAPELKYYPEITEWLKPAQGAQNTSQAPQTHKTSHNHGKRRNGAPQRTGKAKATLAGLWQETETTYLNAPGHRHSFRLCFAGKCKRLDYSMVECLDYCHAHIACGDKDSGTLHQETAHDVKWVYTHG